MEDLLSFYSLVTILLGLVWLLLFLRAKEVRREMVLLGVLSLFVLPTSIVLVSEAEDVAASIGDLTLFDLLFAFSVAGIAGAIYHQLFGKHYHRLARVEAKVKTTDVQLYLWRMLIVLLIFVWFVICLTALLHFSTALSMLLAALVMSLYIVLHRRDLLRDTIWSGVLTALVVFLTGCLVSIISGVEGEVSLVESAWMLGPVPSDLLLWSLALGFVAGPLYEYARRLEIK